MAEIVNLRLARKARARSDAEAQAAENRTRYGTTKADRTKAKAEADRLARDLDGAKRD